MGKTKSLLFGCLVFALFCLSGAMIFLYAPVEKTMGLVQKIFYIHLPLAITTSLSFFILFVCSLLYLWKGEEKWELRGYCAAEVGVVFCFLVLLTGSFWARPVWNTWWTWDPRLTSAFIMWIIYIVYIILRQMALEGQGSRKFASVYGIVGFVSVLITVAAPRLWRTIHPVVIDSKEIRLESAMLETLIVSMIGFLSFYFYIFFLRVSVEECKEEIDRLEWEKMEG